MLHHMLFTFTTAASRVSVRMAVQVVAVIPQSTTVLVAVMTDGRFRLVATRLWPEESEWDAESLAKGIFLLGFTMRHRNIRNDLLKCTDEEVRSAIKALNSKCGLFSASELSPFLSSHHFRWHAASSQSLSN